MLNSILAALVLDGGCAIIQAAAWLRSKVGR